MKKKKVRFDEVKGGEYFKWHKVTYRKTGVCIAASLTGSYFDRFFGQNDNVIPVTVTIKVKEK